MRDRARKRPPLPALLLGGAGLALGCSGTDYVAAIDPASGPGAPRAGRDADASGSDCAGATIEVRRVDGSAERVCPDRLAAQTFGHALCACGGNLIAARGLTTRGFDSSGETSGELGAAVSVNGMLTGSGGAEPSRIGGSVTVAGALLSQLTGDYAIAGDLRAHGDLALLGTVQVARDAWLHGVAGGALDVARDLHVDGDTAGLIGVDPLAVGGQTHTDPFDVAPACNCNPGQLIDVAATIAAAEDDNAALGIDAQMLAALTGETTVALPCGRLRFDAITAPGGLTLQIDGPVVLYVSGAVTGDVRVEFGPEGALDLFASGLPALATPDGLAPVDAPARTRIYSAATELVLGASFAGNLYAPSATVIAPVPFGLSGALFASQIVFGDEAVVSYDRALLAGLRACGAAQGDACDACSACELGLGCRAGSCGECTGDGDCCAPHACMEGRCAPLSP